MQIARLVTYTFDANVGSKDRIFRIASGAALGVAPWLFNLPFVVQVAATVAGAAWLMTGVVSRCGLYYLLGHTTCPVRSTTDSDAGD